MNALKRSFLLWPQSLAGKTAPGPAQIVGQISQVTQCSYHLPSLIFPEHTILTSLWAQLSHVFHVNKAVTTSCLFFPLWYTSPSTRPHSDEGQWWKPRALPSQVCPQRQGIPQIYWAGRVGQLRGSPQSHPLLQAVNIVKSSKSFSIHKNLCTHKNHTFYWPKGYFLTCWGRMPANTTNEVHVKSWDNDLLATDGL